MIIDFAETVNLYSGVDAYPFLEIQPTFNPGAAHKFFGKFDLTFAYHQVVISKEDHTFKALEACEHFWQSICIPFGDTNAVPAFQRFMEQLIGKNGLSGAVLYLDDTYIGDKMEEAHNLSCKSFLDAAAQVDLTLNIEKCVLGTQQLNLLGQVIEQGSERPDRERLRILLDYPVLVSEPQLTRSIGFFSFYAKWVFQYSAKVRLEFFWKR